VRVYVFTTLRKRAAFDPCYNPLYCVCACVCVYYAEKESRVRSLLQSTVLVSFSKYGSLSVTLTHCAFTRALPCGNARVARQHRVAASLKRDLTQVSFDTHAARTALPRARSGPLTLIM